jgi:hypothetical protein
MCKTQRLGAFLQDNTQNEIHIQKHFDSFLALFWTLPQWEIKMSEKHRKSIEKRDKSQKESESILVPPKKDLLIS